MIAYPSYKTDWYFPDAFLPHPEDNISHEAVCILNISQEDVIVELVLYFEDQAPMTGFTVQCGANRTKHIRMDHIKNARGESVPSDIPYALWVHSSHPVFCQYTRVDASLPNRSLMTAMGL